MKKRNLFAIALVLGLALTLVVGLSVSAQNQDDGQQNPDRAQEPAAPPPVEPFEGGEQPLGALSVAETVSHTFSYQGVLEEDGQPVTGDREMIFHLYNNEACTNTVGSPMTYTVAVDDGLFNVDLAFDQAHFNGQALWLEAEVEGTPLGCQTVQAVPYALSLRPGALISGSASFETPTMLRVRYGSSDSSSQGAVGANLGVWALLAGYGVYGYNNVAGWGVYGYAESDLIGWGVQGEADAPEGAGVYGRSLYTSTVSYGVRGEAISSNGFGGYFRNNAGAGDDGTAVVGLSASGSLNDIPGGFYDPAGAFVGPNGLIGATSTDRNNGYGVTGLTQGTSGRGVYGYAITNTGTTYGVYGRALSPDGFGGHFVNSASTGNAYGLSVDGRHGATILGTDYSGIQVESSDGIANDDYGIRAEGQVGDGVFGWSYGTDDDHDTGVTGRSEEGYGLYGFTEGVGQYGGYFGDPIYVNGGCTGCTLLYVAHNVSENDLQLGDLVQAAGVETELTGLQNPVMRVTPAGEGKKILGVVVGRTDVTVVESGIDDAQPGAHFGPTGGTAAPGDHLVILVQGMAQVRVDPAAEVQIGDMAYAGAAGVTHVTAGDPIGIVLDNVDADGLIWVLVGSD